MQPVWGSKRNEGPNRRRRSTGSESAKAAVEDAKKTMPTRMPQRPRRHVAAIEAKPRKRRTAAHANDCKALREEWERKASVRDRRLPARRQRHDLCLQCHQVGPIAAKEQQGPQPDLAAERLRPDWLQRWLANPQRFLHLQDDHAAELPAASEGHEAQFVGSDEGLLLDQIKAVRDFLMIYPKVVDWPVLKDRPAAGSAGGK